MANQFFPSLVYLSASTIYLNVVSAVEAILEVRNRLGLHLRAAAALAQAAKAFNSTIMVSSGDQEVSGKSVTGLIMLGAAQGTQLKIKAQGDDAEQAIGTLKKLFADKFGEE
ncbi:MAG: HPr family phosphocarrier protein [Candidatus Binataceae bacterium]